MLYRILIPLCLISLPAFAQNKPTTKSLIAEPQQTQQSTTTPKGRPQPMEHHSRSTWHYHSGPKRNTLPGDSSATRSTPSKTQAGTDAGK